MFQWFIRIQWICVAFLGKTQMLPLNVQKESDRMWLIWRIFPESKINYLQISYLQEGLNLASLVSFLPELIWQSVKQ